MGVVKEARALLRERDWRGRGVTPRNAVPWERPAVPSLFPTAWARTPAVRAARTGLRHAVFKPLLWSVTTPEIGGREALADFEGPAVFVANHASHLDTPLILGSLPERFARKIAVGAASDYFFDTAWRGVLTALAINAFPIDRGGAGRRHLQMLAPKLLAEGWSLLLFPEGTRSRDGWMNPVRLGAAHLCCGTGTPAVPVAVRGSHAAMPRGRAWPVRGRPRVSVRYSSPLTPPPGGLDPLAVRSFNNTLSLALARLWNEEDAGWYGSLLAQPRQALEGPAGPKPTASWRRTWEADRAASPTTTERRVWR